MKIHNDAPALNEWGSVSVDSIFMCVCVFLNHFAHQFDWITVNSLFSISMFIYLLENF